MIASNPQITKMTQISMCAKMIEGKEQKETTNTTALKVKSLGKKVGQGALKKLSRSLQKFNK